MGLARWLGSGGCCGGCSGKVGLFAAAAAVVSACSLGGLAVCINHMLY